LGFAKIPEAEINDMKLGYARISTMEQNLDLQLDALRKAGAEKIFTDKISGSKAERQGLDQLLESVRAGDTVIIWKLDRLARSLDHLDRLRREFEARQIHFVSITEGFDTSKPAGKLTFHIVGAIAEFERDLIRERTRAGLEAARSRGKGGGRKPVLNADKKRTLDKLLKDSADYNSHARSIGVSERTVRRYVQGEYASSNGTK
jgi:DNA invertase Pin-like site-specific DNA recombinase